MTQTHHSPLVEKAPKATFPRAVFSSAPRDALVRYFHERAQLFSQRCCQGHGAANAASRGDQRFRSRGWQAVVLCRATGWRPIVGRRAVSERQCRSWKISLRLMSLDLQLQCDSSSTIRAKFIGPSYYTQNHD